MIRSGLQGSQESHTKAETSWESWREEVHVCSSVQVSLRLEQGRSLRDKSGDSAWPGSVKVTWPPQYSRLLRRHFHITRLREPDYTPGTSLVLLLVPICISRGRFLRSDSFSRKRTDWRQTKQTGDPSRVLASWGRVSQRL